jgi:hypothetical protein
MDPAKPANGSADGVSVGRRRLRRRHRARPLPTKRRSPRNARAHCAVLAGPHTTLARVERQHRTTGLGRAISARLSAIAWPWTTVLEARWLRPALPMRQSTSSVGKTETCVRRPKRPRLLSIRPWPRTCDLTASANRNRASRISSSAAFVRTNTLRGTSLSNLASCHSPDVRRKPTAPDAPVTFAVAVHGGSGSSQSMCSAPRTSAMTVSRSTRSPFAIALRMPPPTAPQLGTTALMSVRS